MYNNFVKECVANGDAIYMFRAIFGNTQEPKDFTKYSLETRKFVIQQLLKNPVSAKLLQKYPDMVYEENDQYWDLTMMYQKEFICWLCWGVVPPSEIHEDAFDMEFMFKEPDIDASEGFRTFMEKNQLKLPKTVADLFLKNLGAMNDFVGEGTSSNREAFRKYIHDFTENP